jgi:hypothetical protein
MEILQTAVEKLSNSMRIYGEASFTFFNLLRIDKEEAINNLDRAFEAKLEAFHTLYDVTKKEIAYSDHADTSVIIMLRNAIHHRNHNLFKSWNSEMHLENQFNKMKGAAFLMTGYQPCDEDSHVSEYYFKLSDFYERLDESYGSKYIDTFLGKAKREKLLNLANSELSFSEIKEQSESKRYPLNQIYINVIPIYTSAICRILKKIANNGFLPKGYDSDVYLNHFTSGEYFNLSKPVYKQLRVPAVGAESISAPTDILACITESVD